MPEIYEIKNRIDGLKSIHNITYAMQIVTISRLKRITTQLQKLNDSFEGIKKILAILVDENPKFASKFYPEIDETLPPLLVMFYSNRGFCGSFNQDVHNAITNYCSTNHISYADAKKIGVGKKAKNFFKSTETDAKVFEPVKDLLSKEEGATLYAEIQKAMVEKRKIYFCYFKFKSIISQKIVVDTFYPPLPSEFEFAKEAGVNNVRPPYFVEPSREQVENKMLSAFYYLKMFSTIQSSASSEFSQRFLLMKSAVDNVKNLSDELVMELNKERQRGITQEISEIISTFKALSKA